MINDTASLRECQLFQDLVEDELAKLSFLCSDFVVIQDGALFTEGRTASHLYVVSEGQIALQKAIRAPHARRSRRTTVAICSPSEVIGWSALVEPYKYTLSAVAWQSSRLIRIDSVALRRALEMYPDMGFKVMRALSAVMATRLKQTTSTLINERQSSLARL